MRDLFDYPNHPGFKEKGQTSQEAAEAIAGSVAGLRLEVLNLLAKRALTVHESAALLHLPISTVQPRFSELRKLGKIEPTGERRFNAASNKRAHVWRVVVLGE